MSTQTDGICPSEHQPWIREEWGQPCMGGQRQGPPRALVVPGHSDLAEAVEASHREAPQARGQNTCSALVECMPRPRTRLQTCRVTRFILFTIYSIKCRY